MSAEHEKTQRDSIYNLLDEQLISFSQAAKWFPPSRNNRPVSPSCIWRWVRHGVQMKNGECVKLQAVRVAGRYLTSIESLKRFIEVQQTEELQPKVLLSSRSESRTEYQRERCSSEALRKLEKLT